MDDDDDDDKFLANLQLFPFFSALPSNLAEQSTVYDITMFAPLEQHAPTYTKTIISDLTTTDSITYCCVQKKSQYTTMGLFGWSLPLRN